MGASSTRGGMSATSRSVDLGATSELPAASVPNASRLALDAANPDETSTAHLAWLRQSAISSMRRLPAAPRRSSSRTFSCSRSTSRSLTRGSRRRARTSMRHTAGQGACARADQSAGQHGARLKEDLLEVQTKANKMASSTQALMHVINSLRITRKRRAAHPWPRRQGATMDSDASLAAGVGDGGARAARRSTSAQARSGSVAQHAAQGGKQPRRGPREPRCGAPRTRRPSAGTRRRRSATSTAPQAVTEAQRRHTKKGYLQGQVDGLEAEFARIVSIKETSPARDQAVKDIIRSTGQRAA